MALILVSLGLVGLLYGPQWWISRVLKRYSTPRVDIPQSGAEFAQSLIRHVQLPTTEVHKAPPNADHYDPTSKQVKLSPAIHDGRSLAAVAIAAHEVGHAMQHQSGYWPLEARTKLVGVAAKLEKAGSVAVLAIPVLGILSRNPKVTLPLVVVFVVGMLARVLVHLVTLPVEFDASFRRALPYLRQVEYMRDEDVAAAKEILLAAALTYVSQSLFTCLNLWRWLRVLRR